MTRLKPFISLYFLLFVISACTPKNPNLNKEGDDQFESLEVPYEIEDHKINFEDIVYIPIYSDIYVSRENIKCLLSATLSIRNTSLSDTLYINNVNYYNTNGKMVKAFLESSIMLPPMGTINYVIEKEDDSGGAGANFIVGLSAKNENMRPIIQAVMIGEDANRGISFVTEGVSINVN